MVMIDDDVPVIAMHCNSILVFSKPTTPTYIVIVLVGNKNIAILQFGAIDKT